MDSTMKWTKVWESFSEKLVGTPPPGLAVFPLKGNFLNRYCQWFTALHCTETLVEMKEMHTNWYLRREYTVKAVPLNLSHTVENRKGNCHQWKVQINSTQKNHFDTLKVWLHWLFVLPNSGWNRSHCWTSTPIVSVSVPTKRKPKYVCVNVEAII